MNPVLLFTGPAEDPFRYCVAADSLADALQGGEGLVYPAITADGTHVALKMLTALRIADYAALAARAQVFVGISHPNLMRHLETFVGSALRPASKPPSGRDFDVVYTVSEWIPGRPLTDAIGDLTLSDALGLLPDIADAVEHLHRHHTTISPNGIVHRDIKPSNIRVTPDGTPVLIDFGHARPFTPTDMTTGVGTYRWRAPEVLDGTGTHQPASDIWALGGLAHWIVTRQPPRLDTPTEAHQRLLSNPHFAQLPNANDLATHLTQPLHPSPTLRPTNATAWATQLRALNAGSQQLGPTLAKATLPKWRIAALALSVLMAISVGLAYAIARPRPAGKTLESSTAVSLPSVAPSTTQSPPEAAPTTAEPPSTVTTTTPPTTTVTTPKSAPATTQPPAPTTQPPKVTAQPPPLFAAVPTGRNCLSGTSGYATVTCVTALTIEFDDTNPITVVSRDINTSQITLNLRITNPGPRTCYERSEIQAAYFVRLSSLPGHTTSGAPSGLQCFASGEIVPISLAATVTQGQAVQFGPIRLGNVQTGFSPAAETEKVDLYFWGHTACTDGECRGTPAVINPVLWPATG